MFRYIDFPVAIKKPDFEKISQFDGCDISAVNENSENLFKVLYMHKDLDTYKGENFDENDRIMKVTYDKKINLEEDIRFDFQDDFEKWFNRVIPKHIKIKSNGLLITKKGSAHIIHSDSTDGHSRVKINFVFADYTSCMEYMKPINKEELYRYSDGICKGVPVADEKDCVVDKTVKYENWYPVLIDAMPLHRGNNRNGSSTRLVVSYDIIDTRDDNEITDYKDVEKSMEHLLIPKECKFNMLCDV
tara:strand:- start:824 stop:1558 length:735 start_codon:yes stop_codon:yes gene_type:complete